jgi:tetratricopeptide (TPR) repeat protein
LQIDGWWIARATLLATVCVLALASWFVRRDTETAYLASGWFWFLGTLLPMVGMIQLGSASHADRYMYFPLIGLSLLIGMFAVRLGTVVPGILKQLIPVAMYGSLVLMAWATSQQLPYWQNDVILFRRALAVTEDNMYSRVNLSAGLITQAKQLIEEDQPEAARELLLEAYDHAEAGRQLIVIPAVYYDLVTSQRMLGEFAEAARIGRIAVERYPDNAGMWYILGDVYRESGDSEQAAECYRRSLDHKPKMIDSFLRLAELFSVSDPAQAEGWLRGALAVDPDHVEARRTLGDLLLSQGRVDEAIVHYEHALEIEPENVELRESLSNAEETLSGQGH